MAKPKNHYYVLVFTDHGAVYVTKIGDHHIAYWNDEQKPREFSKGYADDLAMGLRMNFYHAVVVTTPYELTSQPYAYGMGEFIWHRYESEEEHNA